MKPLLLATALMLAGTSFAFADDECSKSFGVCVSGCRGGGIEACETKCEQKSNACYDVQYGNAQAKVSRQPYPDDPQPSLAPVAEPKKARR